MARRRSYLVPLLESWSALSSAPGCMGRTISAWTGQPALKEGKNGAATSIGPPTRRWDSSSSRPGQGAWESTWWPPTEWSSSTPAGIRLTTCSQSSGSTGQGKRISFINIQIQDLKPVYRVSTKLVFFQVWTREDRLHLPVFGQGHDGGKDLWPPGDETEPLCPCCGWAANRATFHLEWIGGALRVHRRAKGTHNTLLKAGKMFYLSSKLVRLGYLTT